jgi:radical SAM-linked protein
MTQGFNPHVKIQIAHPLPVGYSGRNEIVDIFLDKEIPTGAIRERLQNVVPDGLIINSIVNAPEKPRSLSALFTKAEYIVVLRNAQKDAVEGEINKILSSPSLVRSRNNKKYDLRPLIHNLEICQVSGADVLISMVLSAESGKTGRPDEVAHQLGYNPSECIIERIRLF